jgi:cysteine desulfurase
VSAATEHHAVLHALRALADEGWEITDVPMDRAGLIDPEAFAAALREDTALATIMLANNETGTVQPIAALAARARERGVPFHTDAVQAPAYFGLDVKELGVDMLSLSAHKFYGPKGVGVLYVREGTAIAPLIHGGSQEFSKRAGTENVAGIIGMAKALELASAERAGLAPQVAALRDRFERELTARLPDLTVIAQAAPRLPGISNVAFAGIEADALVMRLDLDGIAVSTGSACASGSLEPSHVIAALGLEPRWRRCAVRFSFGRTTGEADVLRLAEGVIKAVTELRSFSARGVL